LREVKVKMNDQSKFLGKTLVVGVILLIIISTTGPVVIGYNVKSDITIHESSLDKHLTMDIFFVENLGIIVLLVGLMLGLLRQMKMVK